MVNINRDDLDEARSPFISIKGLSKQFRQKTKMVDALQNVSLTFNKGEFVAIVGESGSGKSTLLQILGGLDLPTMGSVVIGGVDVTELRERRRTLFRQTNIGFVFQFFYLQPFLTLRQNIELPQMFAADKGDRGGRIDKLAEILNITERLDHLPRELSGGQIQRAAIARALANNPQVLLADEPTGNLDQKNAQAIVDLFNRIRSEFGATIVVVTHDSRIASGADRIITLKDGRIV